VAALERGDKPVSLEELAALPTVLTEACKQPVTLADLIDPAALVRVSAVAVVTGETLLRIYAAGKAADISTMLLHGRDANAAEGPRVDAADMRRLVELGLEADFHQWDGYFRGMGDAELKAARRLGEPPIVVGVLSFRLWGRPLPVERDRVVSERAGDPSPDRRRALRGQVTRQLVEQLSAEIERREPKADTDPRRGAEDSP
jgi:hypothetical protein